MRRGLLVLGVVLGLAGPAGAAGAESILAFDTEVSLEGDDAFTVVETLRYDFGDERRHGIFRDVPVRYGRGRSADYRIGLEVLEVTDGDGRARPWRTSRSGRHLRIRIGDPDATVTGVQVYRIRYRVSRGILFFEDHDELYWNATGNAWPVGIGAARVRVLLPGGLDPEDVDLACYTGPQGSVESACRERATRGVASFEATRPLGPREGLSVVLGVPKGVLEEPSALARWLDRLSDWLSAWLLVPLLTAAGMFQLWRSGGRDRGARDSVPVRYEPPAGLSPGELGVVVDEKVDMVDVTASILDLAIRGHLTIEEEESARFLFLRDRDYRLRRTTPPGGGSASDGKDTAPDSAADGGAGETLKRHEAILLTRIFEDGDEVLVSELKNRFYKHLPRVREALYGEVSRDARFFPASPETVRRRWALGGAAVAGLGVLVIFATGVPFGPALAFVAAGAIVLVFSRVMPRRTRRGRRAYEEILGFREFLERVDADRLERMGARTTERFERLLPHAIVLGVADAWADAFAGIYTEPPSWYRSPRYATGFHPRHFVTDVGESLGTLGQTLASQPRSSGSGSSGFGGGGFSGGGFGGGGGGSW